MLSYCYVIVFSCLLLNDHLFLAGFQSGLWGGTEPVAPVKARLKTAKNGENRTNFERLIGELYSAQVVGN